MFKPVFRTVFPYRAARRVILAIMPTLAVLGAGPKGIAIAAKARALEAAGLDAPRVVLIDLAARAEQRGLSFSDLLVQYAQEGLDRDS